MSGISYIRLRLRSLTSRIRTLSISNEFPTRGATSTFGQYHSTTLTSRYFSSRYDENKNKKQKNNKRFNLRALPFSISPEEALDSFRTWAERDQGLRYLMNYNSIRIGAAYVPVWTFDMNIRFKKQRRDREGSSYSWKPPIFEAYHSGSKGVEHDVIYIPGLASYAGYSYRGSLINPVHSTTLIFMGENTEPFGSWMLKDMVLKETGNVISVIPDAWNRTKVRSFSVVKEELKDIVDEAWIDDRTPPPTVQTQVLSARRIFMPTFVIDYQILGLEYRAFVSGCDRSAPVGGVSHRLFETNISPSGVSSEFQRSSRKLFVHLSSGAANLIRTVNLPVLVWMFRPLISALWFVFIRLVAMSPVIGVAGGMFAGFRKVIQPWMDNKKATANWERQRQNEAEISEDENDINKTMNDFTDFSGKAQTHFYQNKEAILQSLSGDAKHQEGDFDWYSDWKDWAEQQWEQQARQQKQYYQQQNTHQQQQQRAKATKNNEYKWPFDPHDPYSVLGIDRNASDTEISNAFRKEMLQYHPDTQPNASEAQKRRSIERSKVITNAYRTIKNDRKAKSKSN